MLQRLKHFFQEDLWNFPLQNEKGLRFSCFKWMRIFYLAVREFYQKQCTLHASSLTYYTLMSIVPLLAMLLAIAKGFGYHEHLQKDLLLHFKDQQDIWIEIFNYAERLLEQTRGGILAGFGLLLLFWSVTQLIHNMEATFNHIWHVKKTRSWRRAFSDYFAVLFLAPFLFIVSSSVTVFVVDQLEAFIRAFPIGNWPISLLLFLVHLIPYGLFSIFFGLIYLFVPNTKVQFSSAFLGGVVAGTLYVIVQWGYIYFQVGVSRYGAIYGSVAALPLFLIWVQVSWFLVLLGAEISYAHQTFKSHEFEYKAQRVSQSFRRLLSLWIVHLAVSRFLQAHSPLSRDLLIHHYQIPHLLAVPILEELVRCSLLIEVAGGYIPAKPADRLKISDVIEALENWGDSSFPFIQAKELAPFEQALARFKKLIETSPHNQLMSHVSNTL